MDLNWQSPRLRDLCYFQVCAVPMALLVPPPCGFVSHRCWSPHRQFFFAAYTPLVFDSLPIHMLLPLITARGAHFPFNSFRRVLNSVAATGLHSRRWLWTPPHPHMPSVVVSRRISCSNFPWLSSSPSLHVHAHLELVHHAVGLLGCQDLVSQMLSALPCTTPSATGMCTPTDTARSPGTIAGISHLSSAGVAVLNQIMEWP